MEFLLAPDNKNCPDEVLLADVREVAARLGRRQLTKALYEKYGRFSAATVQKRFGSWNSACQKSGLEITKRNNIPHDELLADLRRVAGELGKQVVTVAEYKRLGQFSAPPFLKAFGSWAEALGAADLRVSSAWRPRASEDDLFTNLAKVWESLGTQPRQADLRPPNSSYTADSYVRRFGTWRKALEAFVAYMGQESTVTPAPAEPPAQAPNLSQRRTPRDPGWRLRFLVHRRDRFTCCFCGRSPATHVGLVLHVDHVVPWSKGGETTMENLQTLCEPCNIGKSNLAASVDEG